MDFSSVGDFLKKAVSSKQEERKLIEDEVDPVIDDPSTIGIPLETLEMLDQLEEKYGDEAFRQIGLFCLGRWAQIHQEILSQHVQHESIEEAMATIVDLTILSHSVEQVKEIGSFGGDESWRKMLKKVVAQDVLEEMEEQGIDIKAAFGGDQ